MGAVTLAKVRELAPHLPGDDQGRLLLEAALDYAQAYCNRKFDRADVVAELGETVREDAGLTTRCILYVRRPPIFSVESITLEDGAEPVDASAYGIDDNDGRLDRVVLYLNEKAQRFATTIAYHGGWANDAAPVAIINACALYMGYQLDALRIGAVSSESSGGESAGYDSDDRAMARIHRLLNPYRLLSV